MIELQNDPWLRAALMAFGVLLVGALVGCALSLIAPDRGDYER